MDLKQFEKIKARWRAFWRMELDDYLMWSTQITPELVVPGIKLMSFESYLKNVRIQVLSQIIGNEIRNSLKIGDDWVPHLMPQLGTGVFASAFGAEVEYLTHNLPWAKPIIRKEDNYDKVFSLKPPSVYSGQLKTIFEFTKFANFFTRKKYPISATDLQGPADTAYLMWHPQSLILAMYDSPDSVHYLMRLCTDLFIKYIEEHAKLCKEFIPFHHPPLWISYGEGICISDDILAVFNADLWKTFVLPYVNEISEKFGGIIIHSCGNFAHQIENLKQVHNLKGINFGVTETNFDIVWQAFGGKIAVIPHIGLNSNNTFKDEIEFVNFILDRVGAKTNSQKVNRKKLKGLCIVAGVSNIDFKAKAPVYEKIFKIIIRLRKIRKILKKFRD